MREKIKMSNIYTLKIPSTSNIKQIPNQITPNTTFFNTSHPLTEQQLYKINYFLEELLFLEENEEDVPEFTTEVEQKIFNT